VPANRIFQQNRPLRVISLHRNDTSAVGGKADMLRMLLNRRD
jgi:hypothetical protein